jgi:carboxyl-terminal processing protease
MAGIGSTHVCINCNLRIKLQNFFLFNADICIFRHLTTMSSKKLRIWLPLALSGMMIIGMIIGFQLKEKTMSASFFSFSNRSAIQELTDLIKNRYVDPVAIDSMNGIVASDLLQKLDPHSVYIPREELLAVNEEMAGNFQGIGIEFRIINDTVNVLNVLSGGPADKAGMLTGDKILLVNDSSKIAGVKIDGLGVRKLFRGETGTKVKIKFKRGAIAQSVVVTRGIIPVSSIDAAYMLNDSTGYIRINKFAERTYEEFMQSLENLLAKKMKSLVLDLRGNGGGLMKEAVDIADEFLSEDKLIVYTEGEHSPRSSYIAKRPGLFEDGKLAVLIDETAASASEVLAGALQDWDRATIIGRRSFGKGLVQQQFQMSNGAAVRLTVARYYTPLGRNIQKSYSKGYAAYQYELEQRFHTDSTAKVDTAKRKIFITPKGKKVFGEGGITPDSTIGIDSTLFNKQLISLFAGGVINNAAYNYYVNHKSYFDGFTNPTALKAAYKPGLTEWQLIEAEAKKQNIPWKLLSAQERLFIDTRFKALIFRQKWRTDGYYQVLNESDKAIQQALVTLR